MRTVLLPPGVNPIAVNKHIIYSVLSFVRNQTDSNGKIIHQHRMLNQYGLTENRDVKCEAVSHHVHMFLD